jgi:hypothetical protein
MTTSEQKTKYVHKIAKSLESQLKPILKDKLLYMTYSANVNFESSINVVLGFNYLNEKWFQDIENKIMKTINKYSSKFPDIRFYLLETSSKTILK